MAQRLRQFRVTVNITGNAKQFTTSSLKVGAALVTADPTNSGEVYIGDENVLAASRLGIPLTAGDVAALDPTQYIGTTEELELEQFYVDSTSSGDAIIVSYYENEDD